MKYTKEELELLNKEDLIEYILKLENLYYDTIYQNMRKTIMDYLNE